MPTFSRHDIDSMAFRAAESLKEGTSLHDSLVKLSKENSMNPEQIKRLVESTNTTTFLDQFKEKVGNQRMVEFDVADPSKIISEALNTSTSPKSPTISITISTSNGGHTDLFETVENENSPMPTYEEKEPGTKVASLSFFGGGEPEATRKLDIHTKHRVKESLLTKIADCNYRAEDLAKEIALDYRGIYTKDKYASLELDSLSRHGNKAIPGLQLVRSRLGLEKIARVLSPAESFFLADRHVVDTKNEKYLAKLASIIELVEKHKKLNSGLKYLNREEH